MAYAGDITFDKTLPHIMKVIIFGLGNYGVSLAGSLMEVGNEVIGVDKDPLRVDAIKDDVTYAVTMDSTNEAAVHTLPFKDVDAAIVAIGENEGAARPVVAIDADPASYSGILVLRVRRSRSCCRKANAPW